MKAIRDGYPHMALQNGVRINYKQAENNKEWKESLFQRMEAELLAVKDDDRQGIIEMMDLLEAYCLANGWSLNVLDRDRILWEEQCGSFSSKFIEDKNTQPVSEPSQKPTPTRGILDGRQGQKMKRRILESSLLQERELYHVENLDRQIIEAQIVNEATLALEI